ncbi:MAG: LytTR family DNA-binding domain-containing protein, partial [Oscillospiraceae bacterium]
PIADLIERKVRRILGEACRIKTFYSSFAAETYLLDEAKGATDILITDIELGSRENGIALTRRIKSKYPHMKVIFITGHLEFALDIFDAEPVYFLGKPVDDEKLRSALHAAQAALEEDKANCLTIAVRGEVLRLRFSRILYLESELRSVSIHNVEETLTVHCKLSDLEEGLPANFLRCHQSFIINMDRVKSMNSASFILSNGDAIPISRTKVSETRDEFLNYIGDKV